MHRTRARTRGAAYVEITALVAVAAGAGWLALNRVGGASSQTAQREAACIAAGFGCESGDATGATAPIDPGMAGSMTAPLPDVTIGGNSAMLTLVDDLRQTIHDRDAMPLPAAISAWKDRVRTDGDWDFKNRADLQGNNAYDALDHFGNVNYGVTAAALGIDPDVAHRAAGAVQTGDRGPAHIGVVGDQLRGYPYGDRPRDAYDIDLGYSLYEWLSSQNPDLR